MNYGPHLVGTLLVFHAVAWQYSRHSMDMNGHEFLGLVLRSASVKHFLRQALGAPPLRSTRKRSLAESTERETW